MRVFALIVAQFAHICSARRHWKGILSDLDPVTICEIREIPVFFLIWVCILARIKDLDVYPYLYSKLHGSPV